MGQELGQVAGCEEMKLLLDTHIWLWAATDQRRIKRSLTRELARSSNEVWISPISIVELGAQYRKGRLQINGGYESWVEEFFRNPDVRFAEINYQVALEANRFYLQSEDPADRWLVATARVYDLVLVTADEKILASKAVRTLANE